MLLRCLLPLALLPLAAVASAACTLTDPTLTLQSYRVDAQKERIAMYWQDRHGKASGSLRSLLAGIDGDGRVQMAMNGGIYDKAYAPLGAVYRRRQTADAGKPLRRRRELFIRPGGVFLVENGRAKIVPLPAYKPSPAIRYAVQSGPMLIENGAINWRLKPSASSQQAAQRGWYR
ncbi:phosphodiester glycosidase family protein [Klebsiella pneumoniae subsp. pneumoniae]|nr:phosphodiester glycosidase family protein [Klebsiella pneumoniae subsp. pneumoniae]